MKKLAPSQKKILQFISEGLTAKEIAFELRISKRTVDAQMNNMYNITGANNAPHLVKLSIISGDIVLSDSVVKCMYKKSKLTAHFIESIDKHCDQVGDKYNGNPVAVIIGTRAANHTGARSLGTTKIDNITSGSGDNKNYAGPIS